MNDYDAIEDFYSRHHAAGELILNGFLRAKPGENFHWPVFKAARLKKIWQDFGVTKVVRDQKGMESIKDRFLTNVAMLRFTTEMLGHTECSPRSVAEDLDYDLDPKQLESLGDYLTSKEGFWYLSDFGLPQLEKFYGPLFNAEESEEQLYAADKILWVTHQRSDLSGFFVEGGQTTLNEIADYIPNYERN